ncbi:MAG: excinuclease ABC subunit UvrB [Candidatus Komeilibacteria bacterium]|nr:excinuclease ABC subunit UvrB [Candidatus Komeilibacteria bacterium]
MNQFKLVSPFQPTGDQPKAIKKLVAGFKAGQKFQTLLGVTGSGKTFTMANVVNQLQKPTLVICHNKTLAAQLASEFRQFFPGAAVHYFVSYYDYYQPEAYVPQSDTYIAKETQINEEIDRLRQAATNALLSRKDVLIVASVSCIYGLGDPSLYADLKVSLKLGESFQRDKFLRQLIGIQYERADMDVRRGTFRARGSAVEVFLSDALEEIIRVEFDDDIVFKITRLHSLTHEVLESGLKELNIFPAKHFVTPEERLQQAMGKIRAELLEQLVKLKNEGKLLEAERLEQRTTYDLEMIEVTGYCSGIENYSRYLTNRLPGEQPATLLDYFPDDFLMFIDESHMTVPQIGGMHAGDRSRKETLVNFGFRLPSALDNRPLQFSEFEKYMHQVTFVSATPAHYELEKSTQIVEQIIRPTGLIDPQIILRPTEGQIDDVVNEIKKNVAKKQRVLVTVLTKRLAEELAEHLQELGIKAQYLHSEVETLERIEVLRDLRLGKFDALIGVNLLREGLDLPEVSLILILEADNPGFLRSRQALIQTIGRAARHIEGRVIMYGDKITPAMKEAIDETTRRRQIQTDYNQAHGIIPQTIIKGIETRSLADSPEAENDLAISKKEIANLSKEEFNYFVKDLEKQMLLAADNLQFEKAAALRDQIDDIKKLKIKKRK